MRIVLYPYDSQPDCFLAAKDFVKTLLNPDPSKRPSAEEALKHQVRLSSSSLARPHPYSHARTPRTAVAHRAHALERARHRQRPARALRPARTLARRHRRRTRPAPLQLQLLPQLRRLARRLLRLCLRLRRRGHDGRRRGRRHARRAPRVDARPVLVRVPAACGGRQRGEGGRGEPAGRSGRERLRHGHRARGG